MKILRAINKIKHCIFEFLVAFACFFSLYLPFSTFTPYRKAFNKLNDDYIYSFNVESSLFEDAKNIALYHYEYKEEGTTLILNKKGLKMGAPLIADAPLGVYLFEINQSINYEPNIKVPVKNSNAIPQRRIKTDFGEIMLEVDYILLDETIGADYECEYKFCPHAEAPSVKDDMTLRESFSATGKSIKNSLLASSNNMGVILILIATVPATIMLFAMFFYYTMQIEKESKRIIIDYVFYKPKKKLAFQVFLKYFGRSGIFVIVSALINYFLFVQVGLELLFVPLVIFFLIDSIYLLAVSNANVKRILKEGVDIKYVN